MRLAPAQPVGSSERVTGGLGRLNENDRALKETIAEVLTYYI